MYRMIPLLIFVICACDSSLLEKKVFPIHKHLLADSTEQFTIKHIADRFDFPIGKPDAKGYYNAQVFGKNNHLGDDWNAITGGNTDLGDPIYAIADGYVTFCEDHGYSWGNVIRMTHYLPDGAKFESLYAHCDTILVEANNWVRIGDQIGTIGTADGMYSAHLHLEIRNKINMPIGGGYSQITTGYVDPTHFINQHRVIVSD
ncbi:MAG: M23 family metallopeptidase [Crocinitomicaceae bacterium]|nr:M23 family metallopeptidase [Crocinitomicaceae bacterium]